MSRLIGNLMSIIVQVVVGVNIVFVVFGDRVMSVVIVVSFIRFRIGI